MAIFTSTSVGFRSLSGLSCFRAEERKSWLRVEEIPRKKSSLSSGVLYFKNLELGDMNLLPSKLTYKRKSSSEYFDS